MKMFLATTSLMACVSTALAGPALAQSGDEGLFRSMSDSAEIRVSEFIGKRIYATETDLATTETSGVGSEWDEIGEVSDVILTRDGDVAAVLVDIGGFLGIGERTVAIQMDAVRLVSDQGTSENANDYFIVLTASRASLEAAPQYTPATTMTGTAREGITGEGNLPETENQVDTAPGGTPEAGEFAREGYVPAEPEVITVEGLTGATLYDANDTRVGEISELLLDDTGQVQSIIVEAGEFLGVSRRTLAIEINNLVFLRSDSGNELRVYTSLTRGQLESLPAHDL